MNLVNLLCEGGGGYFLQSLKVYIHVYRDDAGMGLLFQHWNIWLDCKLSTSIHKKGGVKLWYTNGWGFSSYGMPICIISTSSWRFFIAKTIFLLIIIYIFCM